MKILLLSILLTLAIFLIGAWLGNMIVTKFKQYAEV